MAAGFHVLAKMKFLRGTPFDVFGYTEERRMERELITEYRTRIERELAQLSAESASRALAVAQVASKIRGFGHVKKRNAGAARVEWLRLQDAGVGSQEA
jgi:indolepyruvate ferredoxin oxidoreductase